MTKSLKERMGEVVAKKQRGTILEISPDIFWPEDYALILVRMLDKQILEFMASTRYVLEKKLEVGQEFTWDEWPLPLSFLNELEQVRHDQE